MERFRHENIKQWYLQLENSGERENLVTNITAQKKKKLKIEVCFLGRRKMGGKNMSIFY